MTTLRGHHLICLHFFEGEGYNHEFIENLKGVLKNAGKGSVTIKLGPDEVCIKCPYLKNEACAYSDHADEEIREMDGKALCLLELSEGVTIEWDTLRGKIPGIFEVWYRAYCSGCGWKRACEKNAAYRELSVRISGTE